MSLPKGILDPLVVHGAFHKLDVVDNLNKRVIRFGRVKAGVWATEHDVHDYRGG